MFRHVKRHLKPLSKKKYINEIFFGFNGGIIKADSNFSRTCQSLKEANNSGLLIAHDCFSLPAAYKLAKQQNIPFIYDAVDYPFMMGRTGSAYRNLPKSGQFLIHKFHKKPREEANVILTISEPMAEHLSECFSRNVSVLNNAYTVNPKQPVQDNYTAINKVRQLHEKGKVICSFGTLFAGDGLPEIIEAFEFLPKNTVFFIFGKFQTLMYENEIQQLLLKQNDETRSRIILLPFLSKAEMNEALKLCSVSILVWQQNVCNLKYGLPNRFWDAVSMGLPVIHGDMLAINQLAIKHDLHKAFKGISTKNSQSLADIISNQLLNSENYQEKIIRMAELEADNCRSSFQNCVKRLNIKVKKTVILSRNSIIKNERIKRQIKWLNELEHNVVTVSMEREAMKNEKGLKIRDYPAHL